MKSYYDGFNAKLLKAIPPARKILELGCANGRLGQRYKGLHPEARWTGVDCCDEALNVARGILDQTLRLDLDTDDLDALGKGFDVVVIGDLLEHLKRPGLLLAQLKRLVTSDARLVLCIPNMNHASVIERLLIGDISYDSEGLLDRTHLQFFSPSSVYKLILDSGWLPNLVDQYVVGYHNERVINHLIAAASELGVPKATIQRNLYLYQLILECKLAPIAPPPQKPFRLSVIVPVNNTLQYNLNVINSPGLKEIDAEIIGIEGAPNASAAFETGVAKSTQEWVIFCHQDVYFPEGSGLALCNYIGRLPESGAKTEIVGFAGLGINKGGDIAQAGLVIDRLGRFDYPGTEQAVSIDEFAILVNRKCRHKLDPALGWHLWATDLCLKSIQSEPSQFPRIARVHLFHNSHNDYNLPDAFHASAIVLKGKYPSMPLIPTLCGSIT